MISEPERGEVEPRILIVAQDVDAARELASLTRLSGCRTAVAFGATMALRLVEFFGPTVVIVERGIGGADACSFAQEIREHEAAGRHALLVGFAGTSALDVDGYVGEDGFDRILRGPSDGEALAEVLAEARLRSWTAAHRDALWTGTGLQRR